MCFSIFSYQIVCDLYSLPFILVIFSTEGRSVDTALNVVRPEHGNIQATFKGTFEGILNTNFVSLTATCVEYLMIKIENKSEKLSKALKVLP